MTISTKQPLGNYVTFKTGKLNSNAAVNDGIYPFFTCAQEIYRTNTWSFDTECVLLGGNNANAIYPIFYYNGKFDAYQRTYVIEPKDNNNIRFFYYAIQKKLGELRQQSTGAATRFLTIGILNNLQIEVPEPAEQLRVSSLLSSYDDLIENNNLRIKILEEMAQRLYAEWFVKFKFPGHEKVKLVDSSLGKIPEGWEIKSLEECSDIQFGFNFKSSNFNEDGEGVMVVRIRDILSGTTKTFSSEFVEDKYKIYPGDLLIGMDGIFHANIWFDNECYLVQRVARIRSELPSYYVWESVKQELDFLQKTITGSTVGHLSNGEIKGFKVLIPKDPNLLSFFEMITLQVINLKKTNRVLTKTRDLLIPQLVTGKRELKN